MVHKVCQMIKIRNRYIKDHLFRFWQRAKIAALRLKTEFFGVSKIITAVNWLEYFPS
jgi:hypothetical protein